MSLSHLGDHLEAAVDWANVTFPRATQASRLEHFRREVEEFLAAPSAEEAADVLLLLTHWAHHAGVDLSHAVFTKLAENETRTWGQPDAAGVVEHIR